MLGIFDERKTAMAWLRCKIGPAAFSDESVVEFKTAEGREVSYFVPKDKVREDGRVLVNVNRRGGETWVILPTAEPFLAILVTGSDIFEEAAV